MTPADTQPDADLLEADILKSRQLTPGGDHYRAYVGPPTQYDFMGATQFRLLTGLGLREEHHVLDIGCGSLRAGRYLLQYLMPNRYIGVEPNSWLWQEAMRREIGQEVQAIKQPRFLENPAFTPADVGPDPMDFIVAQSIYSHTGMDMFQTAIGAAATVLAPNGQFLFTVVTPGAYGSDTMQSGHDASGWIYPACVVISDHDVIRVCAAAGMMVQRLNWFHPRQTWFRAVKNPDLELTPDMARALGNGRPLFDPRFPE